MLKEFVYQIKEFLKKIIKGKEILKLQESNQNEEIMIKTENFKNELKEKTEYRIRLLNLQNEIKEGKIKEEELEQKDINLLKELYYEQIIDLQREIDGYQKKLKVS